MSEFFDRLFKEFPSSIFTRDPNSRIGKLFLMGTEKVDEVKVVAEDFQRLRDPKLINGRLLDLTGEIVREERNGRNDNRYQTIIAASGRKRTAPGPIPSINDVMDIIFGTSFIRIDPGWLLRNRATKKLDGLSFLDGAGLLDPDHQINVLDGNGFLDGTGFLFPGQFIDPAHFELVFDGPVEEIPLFDGFTEFVEEVSAAGVSNSVNATMIGDADSGPSYPLELDIA